MWPATAARRRLWSSCKREKKNTQSNGIQCSPLNGIPQAVTIHNSLLNTACRSFDTFVVAVRNLGSSKATAPDGVAYAHLKNLGTHGIRSLVDIYNQSIRLNVISSLWKRATMIPLLKSDKSHLSSGLIDPFLFSVLPRRLLRGSFSTRFFLFVMSVVSSTASKPSTPFPL